MCLAIEECATRKWSMFVTNVFHIKQNRQQIDSQKKKPTNTHRYSETWSPFFKLLLIYLSYIFQLLLSVNVDEDIDLICTVKPV